MKIASFFDRARAFQETFGPRHKDDIGGSNGMRLFSGRLLTISFKSLDTWRSLWRSHGFVFLDYESAGAWAL